MSSSARILALAVALAAACGKERPVLTLEAAVSAVEPACGDTATPTPVAIRGALPVKVTASLSGSGSTVDATYRAWLGDHPLDDVAWMDTGTLAATVPAGLPPGDYALTIETPFGRRVAREGAFHVQVGTCAPAGAALTSTVEVRPNTVTVGQQVTVVATVTNGGLSPALQVRAAVAAPAGVALRAGPAGPVDVAAGGTATLEWTYVATATTPAGGATFGVEASATDASGAAVVAPLARSNVLFVNAGATLSASAVAPAQVSVGQSFTFSMLVTNAGAAAARVTPDLAIASGPAPAGAATIAQRPATQDVAGGSQQRLEFSLRAQTAGNLTLTGGVSGTDVNSGATLDVAPTAPLALRIQRPPALVATVAAPALVAAGSTFTVTAQVRNDGEATADAVGVAVVAAPQGFVSAGAAPAAQAIPGGGSRDFLFTYRAQNPGAAAGTFAVDAAGVDHNAGTPAVAPRATSASVSATYALSTTATPPAGGTVLCGGAACPASYPYATAPIALTASPAAGFLFAGWTGDCSGTGPCSITPTADHAVGATFVQTVALTTSVAPPGSGAVLCDGGACLASYALGTTLTLSAAPASGWQFVGWTGACAGVLIPTCSLPMTAPRVVGASFVQLFSLATSVTGGSGFIRCDGGVCGGPYESGTILTLTTGSAPDWPFRGWTGDCSSLGACQLLMSQNRSVGASFGWTVSVQVVATGSHGGSVEVSSTAGASTCTAGPCLSYHPTGTVTIVAAPDQSSTFQGWNGDCAPFNLPVLSSTCTLPTGADLTTAAVFGPPGG